MDEGSIHHEPLLSVLMELARVGDNRRILCENGVIKMILEMLASSAVACEAIIVMSTNILCLKEILGANIYSMLLKIAMNDEYEWSRRTVALTALLKLISIQGLGKLLEISREIGDEMRKVLTASENLNFTLVAVSVLMKLSEYHEIKEQLAESSLNTAIFPAIGSSARSTQLLVRLFNLASNFIDQESVRKEFFNFNAVALIGPNMQSLATQLRVAVCNFINTSVGYPGFCDTFIEHGVLQQLMNNFDSSISSDAFEAILQRDLSMKFALRSRLETNEKIQTGFYATKGNWIDSLELRETMLADRMSPKKAVYAVNLDEGKFNLGERRLPRDKNLSELVKDLEEDSKFIKSELQTRTELVAVRVATFLQTTEDCTSHQLEVHLKQLKFKFASSVIPIGSLITGNSFEAALLFKILADQLEIDASLVVDDTGKGWNQVNGGSKIVDLMFDVGKMYEASSYEARKYLLKIS